MDPCEKDKNISNWELLNLAVGIIKVIILLYRVGYYKHGVYYFGVG